MTKYYVDDGGSNTSPYDTWAKAATDIGTIAALTTGGDEIWVASDHAQSTAGTQNIDFNGTDSNPITITSRNTSTDALEAASVLQFDTTSNGDLVWRGHLYCWGLRLHADDDLAIAWDGLDCQEWENCHFEIDDYIWLGNVETYLRLLDCEIETKLSTSKIQPGYAVSNTVVKNLTLTDTGNITGALFVPSASAGSGTLFEDCDFSDIGVSGELINAGNYGGEMTFDRCRLHSGSIFNPGINQHSLRVNFIQCQNATFSTRPLGLTAFYRNAGVVTAETTPRRVGGADDGQQGDPFSWKMDTNSEAKEFLRTLESPVFSRWVDSGSKTITVHVASGVTLQDDEFWIEVRSMNETATPNTTSQGHRRLERAVDIDATPANLATSTETWEGSGVGTKQKVDVTINQAVPGWVQVRAYLAKPDEIVYVCPKIEVA